MKILATALATYCLFQASVATRPESLSHRDHQRENHSGRNLQGGEDVLINCGGGEYTDTQGRVWQADNMFSGGKGRKNTADDIIDTADDTLYHFERTGEFNYTIPLPGGNYEVKLHMAEIYFNDTGMRVFDIDVEGIPLSDVDIVQLGGGVARKALTLDVTALVEDGFLNINFLNHVPKINIPKISAIEISPVAPPVKWSGNSSLPIVAVASANLADGRILSWSAAGKYDYRRAYVGIGKTWTSIFDPDTMESTEALIVDTQHDMFCPGTTVMSDGRVMITGGKNSEATTIYDPFANSWTRDADMNIKRGYHSNTMLGDGSVFTLGGSWSGGPEQNTGNRNGEIYTKDGGWDTLDGILLDDNSTLLTDDIDGVYRSDNHMWLFTAPNGKVFHAGPAKQMHWIDTTGEGGVTDSLYRSPDSMCGNAVMFDIGRILTLGGALNYRKGDAHSHAHVIDVNAGEGAETVKQVADMSFARVMQNSVVLPSGEVVVIGGQSEVELFSDAFAVLAAEIWDPATESFTTLADMKVPRNYHSVAILMKDGCIFVSGGGLCG